MKRSEMIKKFIEKADAREDEMMSMPDTKEALTDALLRIFEEIGMLPPAIDGEATHKIKDRCKWEPET